MFDLSDEEPQKVKNMAAVGIVYECEIGQRFEAGNDGWPTAGRFTLTNAGDTTVSDTLEADNEGMPLTAKWDAIKLEWLLEIEPVATTGAATAATTANASTAHETDGYLIKQDVTLHPLEQEVIAVTDANLALESPLYSVPLHHFIRRTDPTPELIQNLRVIASVQCRVELIDAATGKILIGEWTEDFGADGFGRSTFNVDGTYSGQFYETPISTVPLVTFAGVWKIEGDALTYTLTACTDAEYLRTSPMTKDRIIKIEADRFTYLDAEQSSG